MWPCRGLALVRRRPRATRRSSRRCRLGERQQVLDVTGLQGVHENGPHLLRCLGTVLGGEGDLLVAPDGRGKQVWRSAYQRGRAGTRSCAVTRRGVPRVIVEEVGPQAVQMVTLLVRRP